jgi:hypothetical protein
MAFMQHIDNAVVINVFSALRNCTAARWACGNFLGDGLVAPLTEFHGLFSKIAKVMAKTNRIAVAAEG